MAKGDYNGMPVDEPIILRPGVTHRESDYPGSMKHLALEPEHEERKKKGDLGLSNIPDFEPRPLTGPKPFKLKE